MKYIKQDLENERGKPYHVHELKDSIQGECQFSLNRCSSLRKFLLESQQVFFFLTETDKAIAKFTWENIRAQLTIFLKKKV